MRIESIIIKNYKVFKSAQIRKLSNLAVFLGTNGSGKSTLFDIFGFLSDALDQNVSIAINKRGGFSEVVSRGCDIHKDSLYFELKFRNAQPKQDIDQLITYSLEIRNDHGKAVVHREILKSKRGSTGILRRFLDFRNGEGQAIVNEDELDNPGVKELRDYHRLASSDILAIKGLGQFKKYGAISAFRAMLEKWYISDFRIDHARMITDTGLSNHLSTTGDNLAQVTKYLYENRPDVFGTILKRLPKRVPGINHVEAKETEDGRIILRFQDENFKDPFVARNVSDGTIKMFAYMMLLSDPEPHPLVCIEEPENFLHHDLLGQLCEEIRDYAERGGQVFVTTHSPDLVNGLTIRELFFLHKEQGFTTIQAAQDNAELRELAKQNQLGWLWRNQYIKEAHLP